MFRTSRAARPLALFAAYVLAVHAVLAASALGAHAARMAGLAAAPCVGPERVPGGAPQNCPCAEFCRIAPAPALGGAAEPAVAAPVAQAFRWTGLREIAAAEALAVEAVARGPPGRTCES